MKITFLPLLLLCCLTMCSTKKNTLAIVRKTNNPFDYDLGVQIIESNKPDAPIMLCFHGYGANSDIIKSVHASRAVSDHLVSINFPDYNLGSKPYHPDRSSFGTINEILPMLFMLKKCVIDGSASAISLYGFSAGGGAVVNLLATLNQPTHDAQLQKIGITPAMKKKIIAAIEKGIVILDAPLKSMDEIIAARGPSAEFQIYTERYCKNNMRPIDAIQQLNGLNLTILVHFKQGDEILSNRDDQQFIQRLTQVNAGSTHVVTSNGSHNSYSPLLWQKYKSLRTT